MNECDEIIPPIRILAVFSENDYTNNLFVPILCDAIHTAGVNVCCSVQEFWNTETAYDIIHFQWPEEVVGWNCDDPDKIRQLEERIVFFRSRGARFVYTRHNVRPHKANEVMSRVYSIIETQSDIVVHMGRYSRDEFTTKYPHSRNAVIPHHLYEYTYREDVSIERARQYLNLPQDAFIITTFGEYRNLKEIRMVTKAFCALKEEDKLLLAPRFLPFSRRKKYGNNILKRWGSRLGYYVLMPLLNRLLRIRVGASDELIDNCELPYYIAAADVVFIQRKKALNSGNILLAFLFHKVVVGPDTGNISELLHDTGNPIFCPDNKYDILQALKNARKLADWGKGEANYLYARENLNIEKTGREYIQIYKKLINS